MYVATLRLWAVCSLSLLSAVAVAGETPVVRNLGVNAEDLGSGWGKFRLCGNQLLVGGGKAIDVETGEVSEGELLDFPDIPLPPGAVLDDTCGGWWCPRAGGCRWIGFPVLEEESDLNDDGDTDDRVLLVHDLDTRETTTLKLAIPFHPPPIQEGWGVFLPSYGDSGNWLIFWVVESSQGKDLSGDGDLDDWVLYAYDTDGGRTVDLDIARPGVDNTCEISCDNKHLLVNYRLSEDRLVFGDAERLRLQDLGTGESVEFDYPAGVVGPDCSYATWFDFSGDWLVFAAQEAALGTDLNGDGDTSDHVPSVYNIQSRESRSLPLAIGTPWCGEGKLRDISGDMLAFTVDEWSQSKDLDGDEEWNSLVLHTVNLGEFWQLPRFLRGDCNDDGNVDISDAVCILNWLFLGGAAPGCVAVTNTNGDARSDISDATYLLNHLFIGGPAPVPPYPDCGPGTLPTDADTCQTPPPNCLQ